MTSDAYDLVLKIGSLRVPSCVDHPDVIQITAVKSRQAKGSLHHQEEQRQGLRVKRVGCVSHCGVMVHPETLSSAEADGSSRSHGQKQLKCQCGSHHLANVRHYPNIRKSVSNSLTGSLKVDPKTGTVEGLPFASNERTQFGPLRKIFAGLCVFLFCFESGPVALLFCF